jgi:hypothetical protein
MAQVKRERTDHKTGFTNPFQPDLTPQETQLFRELQEETVRLDAEIDSIDTDIQVYDDSEMFQAIGDLRRAVLRYTQNYERLGFRP